MKVSGFFDYTKSLYKGDKVATLEIIIDARMKDLCRKIFFLVRSQ